MAVPAVQRAPPRAGEDARRLTPDRLVLGGQHSQLGPVAVRLLEVEAVYLADLHRALARIGRQPDREPLVEAGAHRLRDRRVGGLAHEAVDEAEAVLAGQERSVRADRSSLRASASRCRPASVAHGGRAELDDRPQEEVRAADGCALEHDSLVPASTGRAAAR